MNTFAQPNPAGQYRGAVFAVLLFAAFAVVSSCFVIVDSGHVGVVRRLGAVQMESLPEGFHLKRPWMDKVEQMDIRLKRVHINARSSSKDLQNVRTQVTIQYSLNGEVAPLTFQRIGRGDMVDDTLIEPAIQESVKAVTAKYTAEELITPKGRGQG